MVVVSCVPSGVLSSTLRYAASFQLIRPVSSNSERNSIDLSPYQRDGERAENEMHVLGREVVNTLARSNGAIDLDD